VIRTSALVVSGILALNAAIAAAQQAAYPSRPVRLIVANAAGTGPDGVARLLAAKLAENWGQQVVIDNRPGATGLIAAETVVHAAPDGYTLWFPTMTHLVATMQAQRFPLAKDFTPIMMVGATVMVIVVSASLPVKSMAELVAYAKTRPGQLTYGSGGAFGSPHLCMESIKSIAGINMLHVPYKGTPQALTDLIGGRLDASCLAVTGLSPAFAQSGKMRTIAVTSLKPSRLTPGVPTVSEVLPGFELLGWYALQGPPKMARPLVAKINADVTKVLKSTEFQERLFALGGEPTPSTPEEFSAFLHKETARWDKTLRQLGGIQ
jgi:tripartite-type tricarboxylate transporter receptor subunit TctC